MRRLDRVGQREREPANPLEPHLGIVSRARRKV
jgi:hypothetical protein